MENSFVIIMLFTMENDLLHGQLRFHYEALLADQLTSGIEGD